MANSIGSQRSALAALCEAAGRGRLVPFIGAGASRMAGCPGWADFADAALKHFISRGKFTYSQLDQLKNLHPRVKLSMARSLERTYPEHSLDFRTLLDPPGNRDNATGKRLYGILSLLGPTFVTTNYDAWLDSVIAPPKLSISVPRRLPNAVAGAQRNVIYKVSDLTPAALDQPDTVIHLHGSILDPSGMILTTRDYISHYRNDRLANGEGTENYVLTFLERLFATKIVLFIGYGLEELEILEYVMQKARLGTGAPPGGGEIRHYILQGFFSHEEQLKLSLKQYYLDCGIGLIPFVRDERDWDQLLDELDALAAAVSPSEPLLAEKLLGMEGLL